MYMFILICCAHVGDGKLLLTSFIRIMWLLAVRSQAGSRRSYLMFSKAQASRSHWSSSFCWKGNTCAGTWGLL
ncbi:unnamed protein product [Musa banksii]